MLEYLPELMKGLHTSLTLTVASIIVALLLALIFTIILTLKTPVLVWIVRGYITLFTGTPLLVQIFLIYYGPGQFPSLQEYPVVWHLLSEPWLCALIALSLNSAAYTTQLFYGAIRAIPEGQWESGQALGMSKAAIFFRLVMPQMWRHALPGLGNQWLVLLKDTALVSLISVNDLMLQTKSIATRTQEPFTWYIVAAAIYLVITLLSQYILKRIDLRATRFERRPG